MTTTDQRPQPVTDLEIFDLYLAHQNADKVGELVDLTGRTVRGRLAALGITLGRGGSGNTRASVHDLNSAEALSAIRRRLALDASRPICFLPAREYLRTLNLYLELQSTAKVGKVLGLSGRAVGQRLRMIGLKPKRPWGTTVEEHNGEAELAKIRLELEQKIQQEGPDPKRIKRNSKHYAARVTAAEKLAVLELYLELQSTCKVAERLGLKTGAVGSRSQGLGFKLRPRKGSHSQRFEDVNDAALIQAVLERLRAEVAGERTDHEAAAVASQ